MADADVKRAEADRRNDAGEWRSVSPPGVVLGLITAGAGAVVLLGWGWDVACLKSVLPGFVTMKPNTAVGFVAAGVSLALWGGGGRGAWRRAGARVCAGAAALLGLLTLGEYLLGLDLKIDQLLFGEAAGAVGTLAPGRMAPASALNFMLLGAALILAGWRRTLPAAQRLILLAGLIGLLSLMGYWYGAPALYGVGHYTQMAVHTAVLFMLASVGVHLLHPAEGLMAGLTPGTMGGWLLRRMMPFVIGVPLVLGWLRVRGERAGCFDGPLGVALMMVITMFLLATGVWWTALTLTRMDAIRRKTEAELQAALARVRESDAQFLAVMKASSDAIQLIGSETFVDCNEATVKMFGCRHKDEILKAHPSELSPPVQPDGRRSAEKASAMIGRAFREGFHHFEWTHRRADGEDFPAEVSLAAIAVGGRPHLHCVVRDMSAQRRAAAALRQLSRVVEQTPASVVIADTAGAIEYVNPAFTRVTGYTAEEARGQNPRMLKSGLTPAETYAEMWRELLAGREWRGELLNRAKNGELFWELAVISPLRDADGRTTHYVAVKENITGRKEMENELRSAARTDKLTGLPNRALLCDRLQQAVLRAQRLKDYRFAVLFLDFDRFKIINDSLGHDVGDLLLQEIARRLRGAVRGGDSASVNDAEHTTARLGGDEFVVLLDGLKRPEDAAAVAQRLLEVFAQPYRLREHDVYSTASIGIVTSDVAAETAEQVLRDADTAMYEAKLAGKGQYVVFSAPMRQRVLNRLELENDLRKALDGGQLFLVYQPIISLQTGRIEQFEALLRWRHPERGLVFPGEFIGIAEETGLILPIGEWVLREACGQLARWRRSLGQAAPRSISVNLSRVQLALRSLPEMIRRILHYSAIPASCLHLEVTESAVMRDVSAAIRTLDAIKAIGVKLAMDDFGTGYSSLACLHQFPIDVLKIDRSFIANIERGRDYAALVQAVTQLARNLNIKVVAEGVETPDQALILQSLECELGQGDLFGKPLAAEQVPEYRVNAGAWNARGMAAV